jgi:hypothetical protein
VVLCNPECEVEPVTFPEPDEVIAMDAEPAANVDRVPATME